MTYEEEKQREKENRKTETALMKADRDLADAITKRTSAGNEMAVIALRKLMSWVPECGFPHSITPAYYDDERDNTEEDDTEEEYREEQGLNNDLPFCCEAYTYEVWGKDDARSFLSYLEQIARALGLGGLHDRRLR